MMFVVTVRKFNPRTHTRMVVKYPDGMKGWTIVLKKNVPGMLKKGFKVDRNQR